MTAYEPKTDEEIKQLAVDTVANRIFWMTQVEHFEDVRMIFMPLALSSPDDWKDVIDINPVLYEYLDKAGPRSINGYPCFFSCKYVSAADYNRMVEKHKAIKAAIDAA